MKTEKRIHPGHKEWKEAIKDKIPIRQIFGKYQYIFSSKKGKISCVRIMNILIQKPEWEIYCLEGNLFEDTERFNSFEECKKRAGDYLI